MEVLIIFLFGLSLFLIAPNFNLPRSINNKKYSTKLKNLVDLGIHLPDARYTMLGTDRGMIIAAFGELTMLVSILLLISKLT